MNTSTTRTNKTKVLLGIAGSLLALLSVAVQPAAADAPVITTNVIRVTNPVPFELTCPSFNVLVTFTVERRNITFYENGSPVLQRRHINFEGTLYNAVTGYSVPYDGTWTRTQDFVENTVTYTGKRFQVQIPGQGVLALEVGRLVLDFSANPPQVIFEAGQHEFNTQLCHILNN
ncbi:MAG: hypothetical protein ABIO92_00970 [Chloroflexia bacterium]